MSSISRFMGVRLSGVLFLTAILAGCGGGSDGGNVVGGGGGSGGTTAATVSLNDILAGNATLAGGDSSAPFTSNLPAGVVAVSVNSPPVVNFAITSADGKPVTGLTTSEVRIALAKLVPGTPGNFGVPGSGNPDQWVSYIYRQVTGTAVPAGAWR